MKHGVTFDIIHSVYYSYSQSHSSRNARNRGKGKGKSKGEIHPGTGHEGPERE